MADTSQAPIKNITITIKSNTQNEFTDQLKNFADANAFAIRIGQTQPDGKHILIQMWREDIKIIGVNPFEPGEFRISFYRNCEEPIDTASVAKLIQSLRSVTSKINGASFVEE